MDVTRSFLLLFLCSSSLIAAPVITSLSHNSGQAAGGNSITITGSGFTGATAVTFGATDSSFRVDSDSTITVTEVPASVAQTVDVTVTSESGTSELTVEDRYTYKGERLFYTITDDGTFVPINAATGSVGAPIVTGFCTSAAITPDGQYGYVTDASSSQVSIVELATNSVLRSISLPFSDGGFQTNIACTIDGDLLFVIDATNGFLYSISTGSDEAVVHTILSGGINPFDIVLTPDSRFACITYPVDAFVSVIDFENNNETRIALGSRFCQPFAAAMTPDGRFAYVTDRTVEKIHIIEMATQSEISSIMTETVSEYIAITPDGHFAYVTNPTADTITKIDLNSNAVVATVALLPGTDPGDIVCTPDSKTVYVTSTSTGTILPIDVQTNGIGEAISGFQAIPFYLVMTPDQAPQAQFSTPHAMRAQKAITFDASASQTPVGSLIEYSWDFGDGSAIEKTESPTINHTYESKGEYTVELTVTNSSHTSLEQTFMGHGVSNQGSDYATVSRTVVIEAPRSLLQALFSSEPEEDEEPSGPSPQMLHSAPPQISACIEAPAGFKARIGKRKRWNFKWKASTSPDIVAYEIYQGGKLVKTVPATSKLQWKNLKRNKKQLKKYRIRAVSVDGVRSDFRQLRPKSRW